MRFRNQKDMDENTSAVDDINVRGNRERANSTNNSNHRSSRNLFSKSKDGMAGGPESGENGGKATLKRFKSDQAALKQAAGGKNLKNPAKKKPSVSVHTTGGGDPRATKPALRKTVSEQLGGKMGTIASATSAGAAGANADEEDCYKPVEKVNWGLGHYYHGGGANSWRVGADGKIGTGTASTVHADKSADWNNLPDQPQQSSNEMDDYISSSSSSDSDDATPSVASKKKKKKLKKKEAAATKPQQQPSPKVRQSPKVAPSKTTASSPPSSPKQSHREKVVVQHATAVEESAPLQDADEDDSIVSERPEKSTHERSVHERSTHERSTHERSAHSRKEPPPAAPPAELTMEQLKEQMKEQMRQEMKQKMKEELAREELKQQVERELRAELEKEVRQEVRKELNVVDVPESPSKKAAPPRSSSSSNHKRAMEKESQQQTATFPDPPRRVGRRGSNGLNRAKSSGNLMDMADGGSEKGPKRPTRSDPSTTVPPGRTSKTPSRSLTRRASGTGSGSNSNNNNSRDLGGDEKAQSSGKGERSSSNLRRRASISNTPTSDEADYIDGADGGGAGEDDDGMLSVLKKKEKDDGSVATDKGSAVGSPRAKRRSSLSDAPTPPGGDTSNNKQVEPVSGAAGFGSTSPDSPLRRMGKGFLGRRRGGAKPENIPNAENMAAVVDLDETGTSATSSEIPPNTPGHDIFAYFLDEDEPIVWIDMPLSDKDKEKLKASKEYNKAIKTNKNGEDVIQYPELNIHLAARLMEGEPTSAKQAAKLQAREPYRPVGPLRDGTTAGLVQVF